MAGETPPPVQNPLETCPLEVWSKILEKLDCPTDVATCYRIRSDWMTLLKPNRANFLMPEVFPLIVKYLTANKEEKEEQKDEVSTDTSDLDEDALSDDSVDSDVDDDHSVEGTEEDGNLIPNRILSTRLVCKSWKYAVDSFLENHPYHTNIALPLERNPDSSDVINEPPINHYFDVSNLDELESLLETDFPPNHNPIFTRHVQYSELGVDDGQDDEANLLAELRSAFTNLLQLHGTHIWHASFIFEYSRSKKMEQKTSVYRLIHAYFDLMPNLKTLSITFNTSSRHRSKPFSEQFFVLSTLPTFEHLTTLRMVNVPAPIDKGMLLTNKHIQKLFWLSESISGKVVEDPNRQMNNLEEFTTTVNLEKDLLTLQSLPWPLQQLAIHSPNLSLDLMFRAISASRFANNLKRLVVKVAGDEGVHKLKGKLELPNLITFRIRVEDTPLKSIDFLLPTSVSLCNLQIEMKREAESTRNKMTAGPSKKMGNPKPNQVVQFDAANMLESNIWNHFPNLKHLKIVKHSQVEDGKKGGNHSKNEKFEYTREKWAKFLKKQSK